MIETILIQGLLISGLYSLIAVGFTMIYGVGGVLNLSHAGYVMIASYVYYTVTQKLGLPTGLACFSSVVIGTGLGLLTYRGLVRRFLDNPTVVFVSTFILALVMDYLMVLLFTPAPINAWPIIVGTVNIFGVSVSSNLLLAMIVSWISLIAVFIFTSKTHLGRAIRALSMDKKGAIVSGIDAEKVNLVTWALSGSLAGLAGEFFGSYTYLTPSMWVFPLIMAFAIVIVGGLGSITGTVLAAHIIGMMETITTLAINERLRGIFAIVLMIIVLIIRPKGFFGRET